MWYERVLEDRTVAKTNDTLERIVTLPLCKRSPFIIWTDTSKPWIMVLWCLLLIFPFFTKPTLDYRKVPEFARNFQGCKLPYTVEIPPNWLEARRVTTPSTSELQHVTNVFLPTVIRLNRNTLRSYTIDIPSPQLKLSLFCCLWSCLRSSLWWMHVMWWMLGSFIWDTHLKLCPFSLY